MNDLCRPGSCTSWFGRSCGIYLCVLPSNPVSPARPNVPRPRAKVLARLTTDRACRVCLFAAARSRVYGSVLPRAIPWGVAGALEGALIEWASTRYDFFEQFRSDKQGGAWFHPYAFHVFGMLLGFALVMRIQIAYQRYWEGTTQCHTAAAKWADAVMQTIAFDEASKDAFSEEGLEFRMLILHYASLMHACALVDIRRDDDLGCALSLNREDPYLFRPNANPALVDGGRAPVRTSLDGPEELMGHPWRMPRVE